MPFLSQTVIKTASGKYHSLFGARTLTNCDTLRMEEQAKNGGPNHLRAWRLFRELTQEELAAAVGTNQNMILYLETGERGLSARWLRRLAGALETSPGLLLDYDPETAPKDLMEIWIKAPVKTKREIAEIAETLLRSAA